MKCWTYHCRMSWLALQRQVLSPPPSRVGEALLCWAPQKDVESLLFVPWGSAWLFWQTVFCFLLGHLAEKAVNILFMETLNRCLKQLLKGGKDAENRGGGEFLAAAWQKRDAESSEEALLILRQTVLCWRKGGIPDPLAVALPTTVPRAGILW